MFIYVGGGDRESSRGPTQTALIWTTTSKTNLTSYNRSHSTSVKNLYCFSSIYPLDLTVSGPDASTFGTLATVNKVLDTLSMPVIAVMFFLLLPACTFTIPESYPLIKLILPNLSSCIVDTVEEGSHVTWTQPTSTMTIGKI